MDIPLFSQSELQEIENQKEGAEIRLFFDGACGPVNPGGDMGFGAVIIEGDLVIYEHSEFCEADPGNSNNVAEYTALARGMEWLLKNGYRRSHVLAYGDSKLVVNQLSGVWGVKGGRYINAYLEASDFADQFTHIRFKWIPRNENSWADSLSRCEGKVVFDKDATLSSGKWDKYGAWKERNELADQIRELIGEYEIKVGKMVVVSDQTSGIVINRHGEFNVTHSLPEFKNTPLSVIEKTLDNLASTERSLVSTVAAPEVINLVINYYANKD